MTDYNFEKFAIYFSFIFSFIGLFFESFEMVGVSLIVLGIAIGMDLFIDYGVKDFKETKQLNTKRSKTKGF